MSEAYSQTLDIKAPPERVFSYFVDPKRIVRWMGDFARLEAVVDGAFSVDINGVLIRGHYVSLKPPHLIEIAWGELGSDVMPPGATRLVIELAATDGGTRLTLTHSGLHESERGNYAVGWEHFLERLASISEGIDPGPDPFATAAGAS